MTWLLAKDDSETVKVNASLNSFPGCYANPAVLGRLERLGSFRKILYRNSGMRTRPGQERVPHPGTRVRLVGQHENIFLFGPTGLGKSYFGFIPECVRLPLGISVR